MLTDTALHRLNQKLQACIESFRLHSELFGQPASVEKAANEAERAFHGYSKAKPNRDDAFAVARDFLRGEELDVWKRDLIASVLTDPIPEAANALVISNPNFNGLLAKYEAEVGAGDLWRLTWHWLLTSYFSFNPIGAPETATKGWTNLREFLERTWPSMSSQSGVGLIPDWVNVLRIESAVLTRSPVDKYAARYLDGETDECDRLKSSLGIPPSSWFWHQLVLGALRSATGLSDLEFQRYIPRLIELIRDKPAFRDEAIEIILTRYNTCVNAKSHDGLRDFVIHQDVWRNPKLKASGIAPAWNRVPDEVWRMVMAWVTERALKDFFDILAARNSSDAGRLEFWSKYLQQIVWTRLVFGSETMALQHSNKAVKDLIARERGDYAQLLINKQADAFMMQIGNYVAVEFSVTPNAAYVYNINTLKFDRNAIYYNGGTDDLKYGFPTGEGLRILHPPGWEQTATRALKRLGIYPDASSGTHSIYKSAASALESVSQRHTTQRGAPVIPVFTQQVGDTNKFTMTELHHYIEGKGAQLLDERGEYGGRLWVVNYSPSRLTAGDLQKLGFNWSVTKAAWFYGGD